MNGASGEPCAKMRIRPSSVIRSTIGSSHHFLRIRMKDQSSANIESLDMIEFYLFLFLTTTSASIPKNPT